MPEYIDKIRVDKDGIFTANIAPSSITFTSMVPTGLQLSQSATGGNLSNGTYSYRVSAVTDVGSLTIKGESLCCSSATIVLSGGTSTQTVTLSWNRVVGAVGYKIYGRTTFSGPESYLATVNGNDTVSWVDTGTTTPSGAQPTSDTASAIYCTNATDGIVQIGVISRAAVGGCAVGYNSNAENYGVALGWYANGSNHGVAGALQSNGSNYGVGLSYTCDGSDHGVGLIGNGSSYGVSFGTSGSDYSVGLGYAAAATTHGVAVGMFTTTNSKGPAVCLGHYTTAKRYGEFCINKTAQNAVGKHSWSIWDWYGTTTNNTATELFLNGTASNRAVLENNSGYFFTIRAIARDHTNNVFKGWTVRGVIARHSNAASTEITSVTSTTYTTGGGTTGDWVLSIAADTTNGALKVEVTGATGVTVKWNIAANISEGGA